jgi:AcrR family transcriptional regulator
MQASPQRRTSSTPGPELDHHARLVAGMSTALMDKSYAELTVADIVRAARVSKRTFYEHFGDKEACFLAAYAAMTAEVLSRIAAAASPHLCPEEQLEAATRAYVAALEEHPPLTRAFLADIQAAGPKALEARRSVHQRFATLLRALVDRAHAERTTLRPLSPEMATAVVGGINELVLNALEGGSGLAEVGETAVALLRALILPTCSRCGREGG